MVNTLNKSSSNRVIFGVCGGLAEYFQIDPVIVRVVFVVLTIWGGLGLVVYIILAVLMPNHTPEKTVEAKPGFRKNSLYWLGIAFIILGILLLLESFNNIYQFLPDFQIDSVFFPLLVIFFGIWFLTKEPK